MQRIEYKTQDKSTWGPGAWQDEPDKIQWMDETTGLPCLMVRNRSGCWCGYVGVPNNHPWYGQGYDDCAADAHGGLTFAAKCQPGDEADSICHIVESGESDDVWWLGFDTAHVGDLAPARSAWSLSHRVHDVYRDQPYVTQQVITLAQQIMEAKHGPDQVSSSN